MLSLTVVQRTAISKSESQERCGHRTTDTQIIPNARCIQLDSHCTIALPYTLDRYRCNSCVVVGTKQTLGEKEKRTFLDLGLRPIFVDGRFRTGIRQLTVAPQDFECRCQ